MIDFLYDDHQEAGFVSGNMKVLQRVSRYEFAVELWMMRDGVNENKWDFQNIEANYKTFVGTPILIAYVGNKVGDGHNHDVKVDRATGERYTSYMSPTAERIVGTISENAEDLRVEQKDGQNWIVAKGRLWAVYAPELVEKIVMQNEMSVSVEVNAYKSEQNGDITVFTEWEGVGVTILGDGVAPAVPGANIKKLAALKEEFRSMKLHVASLSQPVQGGLEQQEKPKNKGVKKLMFDNKTLTKALQAKFPGYRVLAYSEDGNDVVLMSADGSETFSYAFAESDNGTVIAERIKPITLSGVVSFGEDNEVIVPLSRVYDDLAEQNKTLTSQLENALNEKKALEERIEAMNAIEKARRIKASRAAALNQLSAINANREADDAIAEECIASVLEAADNGEYVECVDAEGQWIGEARAESAVRDIAMQKQIELDKARAVAKAQASKKRYAFESGAMVQNDSEGNIASLYARITK